MPRVKNNRLHRRLAPFSQPPGHPPGNPGPWLWDYDYAYLKMSRWGIPAARREDTPPVRPRRPDDYVAATVHGSAYRGDLAGMDGGFLNVRYCPVDNRYPRVPRFRLRH